MRTNLSECPRRIYSCVLFIHLDTFCIGANFSSAPGSCSRFRVAPVQVEQPELIAPRCGSCWTKGSMMSSEFSETPPLVFRLLFWYFNTAFLLINITFPWPHSCMFPFSRPRRMPSLFQGFYLLICVLGCVVAFNLSRAAKWCFSPWTEATPVGRVMDLTARSPGKIIPARLSIIFVFFFGLFVQIHVIWLLYLFLLLDYLMPVLKFKVSEAIRFFQPYITSKAIYPTAFGPKSNYFCLQFYNIICMLNPFTVSILCKAYLTIATIIFIE